MTKIKEQVILNGSEESKKLNMKKQYYVYILTNYSKTLYTGMTNNLARRIYEHKNKIIKGFASRYKLNKLVYFEITDEVRTAILREKQIKGWLRKKKIDLIEKENPSWKDLSEDWD
jgi:putative endonuclease